MSCWQKTESGWQRTDGPVPEQKKPEKPTAGQLETPTHSTMARCLKSCLGLSGWHKTNGFEVPSTMSRWQKTRHGWQKTDGPVPEQKTKAAAPHLAVPTEKPTAGQLDFTTPALGAPFEPPLLRPTEEQAAKRAALLKRLH